MAEIEVVTNPDVLEFVAACPACGRPAAWEQTRDQTTLAIHCGPCETPARPSLRRALLSPLWLVSRG